MPAFQQGDLPRKSLPFFPSTRANKIRQGENLFVWTTFIYPELRDFVVFFFPLRFRLNKQLLWRTSNWTTWWAGCCSMSRWDDADRRCLLLPSLAGGFQFFGRLGASNKMVTNPYSLPYPNVRLLFPSSFLFPLPSTNERRLGLYPSLFLLHQVKNCPIVGIGLWCTYKTNVRWAKWRADIWINPGFWGCIHLPLSLT